MTQVYRKIASCSSKETNLELTWSQFLRIVISSLKRSVDIPSSFLMQSGWPVSNSSTHPSLDKMEVWYGSGSLWGGVGGKYLEGAKIGVHPRRLGLAGLGELRDI